MKFKILFVVGLLFVVTLLATLILAQSSATPVIEFSEKPDMGFKVVEMDSDNIIDIQHGVPDYLDPLGIPDNLKFFSIPSTKIIFFDGVMTIEKDGTFTYMGEEIQGAPEVYEALEKLLNGGCDCKQLTEEQP